MLFLRFQFVEEYMGAYSFKLCICVLQDLPCCFHERIEQFAVGPHKAWIISHGSEYHFYVEHRPGMTYICGPYWTAFCQAYDIQPNDLVRFDYDDQFGMFDVEVTNANNEVKRRVRDPGM